MIKLSFILLSAMLGLDLSSQVLFSPDTLLARVQQQANLFPYEKLHLQTDKSVYVGGEAIWFRAFPVDGVTNEPSFASRYIYTELIDSLETVVSRTCFRMEEDSIYAGNIPLDVSLPEGQYILRAYTRYMENGDKEYFFRKPIRILPLARKTDEGPVYIPREKTDYQVDFLPEGGRLLAGTPCRIAFKALNSKGLGEDVYGWILDEKKDTLQSFRSTHRGMGVFTWRGEKGKKYEAHCRNAEGLSRIVELPEAEENAYSLKVEEAIGKVFVLIQHSEGMAVADSLLLFAHQRGRPLYSEWVSATQNEHYSFDKQLFSSGTVHWLLVDSQGRIISERLAFIRNADQASLTVEPDKSVYSFREKVCLAFTLKDCKGNPVSGNFSLAVTDKRDVRVDSTITILSSLLLASDLRGYIEDPAWYFKDEERKTQHALDVLMLTQGWRRYDMAKVFCGAYTRPAVQPEQSMCLSGSVKTLVRRKPVENASVRIWSPGVKMLETVVTDSAGCFSLKGFEFPDTTSYHVYAVSEKGKENILLEVDAAGYPSAVQALMPILPETQGNKKRLAAYEEKTSRYLSSQDSIRTILLDEVTISARKKKEYKTPYQQSMSTKSIMEEEIRQSPTQDLGTLLQSRFPGVAPYDVGECYFLFDGVSIENKSDRETILRNFSLENIAQVDVLKGPETVGFNPTAKGNVLIAITTKRGFFEPYEYGQKNRLKVQLMGYRPKVRFYSPAYETEEDRNRLELDLRTTLYWCPKVQTDKEGKAFVEFYTSDSGDSFSVVAEGMLDNGQLFRLQQDI